MSRGSSGTGHYTQLVWAETDRIGCGSVYYRVTLFFICFVFLLKLAGNTSGLRYGGQNLLALPIFSTKKQQSFHEIKGCHCMSQGLHIAFLVLKRGVRAAKKQYQRNIANPTFSISSYHFVRAEQC